MAAGIADASSAPRLPGFGGGRPAEPGVGASFVTRRSFSGKAGPPVLQGERYAMVTRELLTVCIEGEDDRVELYRLDDDPAGATDVAARMPDVAARQRLAARQWWDDHARELPPHGWEIDEELRERLRSLGYLR